MDDFSVKPAELLISYVSLFIEGTINGPILDLAYGDGHNGIFFSKEKFRGNLLRRIGRGNRKIEEESLKQ